MDKRGIDMIEILREDGRGIAAVIISSWSGNGEPSMVSERTNENTRKESGLG